MRKGKGGTLDNVTNILKLYSIVHPDSKFGAALELMRIECVHEVEGAESDDKVKTDDKNEVEAGAKYEVKTDDKCIVETNDSHEVIKDKTPQRIDKWRLNEADQVELIRSYIKLASNKSMKLHSALEMFLEVQERNKQSEEQLLKLN